MSCVNNVRNVIEVKHLVAQAFLGAKGKLKLIHKDGDFSNICLDNLEIQDISSLQNEIWKDVKGYEDSYQVSNFGRVKAKERYEEYHRKDTKERCMRHRHEFIMKLVPTTSGYVNVALRDRQNEKYIDVHIENLEWCTPRENTAHAISTGLSIPHRGLNRRPVKIKCIENGEVYDNIRSCASKLNISYQYLMDRIKLNKHCHGLHFERIENR